MAGEAFVNSVSAVRTAVALLAAFGLLRAPPAAAKCQLQQAAELHIAVENHRALVPVEINGQRVRMIVDTGASTTILFPDAARRLGLMTRYLPGAIRVSGVGGQAHAQTAVIDALKLDQAYAVKSFMVVVAGGHGVAGGDAVGLLGQDILSNWDVELDLAHGLIRLLHPVDCKRDEMVYWGAAYAQTPIEPNRTLLNHTTVRALLNGKAVDAFLDTGAQSSVVTLAAAAMAGIRPTSAQVQQAGLSHGLGDFAEASWTATFDTFGLGEETINHAKIRMADLFEHNTHVETGSHIAAREDNLPEMLLGADFFLSHHVLISNSQRMVYFSYNGGPVFDASPLTPKTATAPDSAAAGPNQQATKPPQVGGGGREGG